MKPLDAILLLGPTASGKTPLGNELQHRGLGARPCFHFDFGRILREVAAGRIAGISSEERREIQQLLERGALMEPHHLPLAEKLIRDKIRKVPSSHLLVLNGLPRNLTQARALTRFFQIRGLIHLDCPPETSLHRIACDTDGDRERRTDDQTDLVRQKFEIFQRETQPLLSWYQEQDVPILTVPVQTETTAVLVAEQVNAEWGGAQLRTVRGRPVIFADGLPTSSAVYCDYILRGDWAERVGEFAESGVKIFHLPLPHGDTGKGEDYFDSAFWTGDGQYPDTDDQYALALDRQVEIILAACPDARFYVKFWTTPPLAWTREHPEDMQTDEDGHAYREASLASPRLHRDINRYMRHLVTCCESRYWGDRILGYLGVPYGEGCMQLTIAGKMFDVSPATENAFAQWLKQRYPTDQALQNAWHNPEITLETARIPRDRDWLKKSRETIPSLQGRPLDDASISTNSGGKPVGLFHWAEEADTAIPRDYCRFMREQFLTWVRALSQGIKEATADFGRKRLLGLDIIKQHQIGWQIKSSFDGIGDGKSFPHMFAFSGSFDMAPLLNEPGLDLVWNPADYFARTLGFGWESEGLTSSLILRGKTAMIEDDARCYVGSGRQEQGAFRNDIEVRAGLLRNAAVALSRGVQNYWCNVGSSYFHAPGIQRSVRDITRLFQQLSTHPHRETPDAIAMVVDDTALLYEDFTSSYHSLALIHQRVRALAHCGVPYRIFLLSDLEHEAMPAYRTWLFPNLFRVDDQVIALLRHRVLRHGNLAIFGPATGITDGQILSPKPASTLLGVPMELLPRTTVRHVIIQDSGHPITHELPAAMTYGDSLPYGPTLVPEDAAMELSGVTALGHANTCWFIHRTGLFLRECGKGAAGNGQPGERGADDYAMVWSVAMPLPPELLRACARYAGSHIWCEENDVISASDSLVSLHSVKQGARTIKLPRPLLVRDALTNRAVGSGPIQQIRLRITPPATRIFTLEEPAGAE